MDVFVSVCLPGYARDETASSQPASQATSLGSIERHRTHELLPRMAYAYVLQGLVIVILERHLTIECQCPVPAMQLGVPIRRTCRATTAHQSAPTHFSESAKEIASIIRIERCESVRAGGEIPSFPYQLSPTSANMQGRARKVFEPLWGWRRAIGTSRRLRRKKRSSAGRFPSH